MIESWFAREGICQTSSMAQKGLVNKIEGLYPNERCDDHIAW